MSRVTYEREGHIARIGLNRADKRNAFDWAMFEELSGAYETYEADSEARCALLFAHGAHFTAGLDLGVVGPDIASGRTLFQQDRIDPLGLGPKRVSKPVVAAVQGYCLTIGVELSLGADVVIAADDTKMSQIEVQRGIYPFGGATLRLPQVAGWGNAMRWLLTGDLWDAAEALRLGVVQQVVPAAEVQSAATTIAERIAAQAPLAVKEILASARNARDGGFGAEIPHLLPRAQKLMATADAKEGMNSFLERRAAKFEGR